MGPEISECMAHTLDGTAETPLLVCVRCVEKMLLPGNTIGQVATHLFDRQCLVGLKGEVQPARRPVPSPRRIVQHAGIVRARRHGRHIGPRPKDPFLKTCRIACARGMSLHGGCRQDGQRARLQGGVHLHLHLGLCLYLCLRELRFFARQQAPVAEQSLRVATHST